jgi:transcriptional regulator with XRE-family HTH domain
LVPRELVWSVGLTIGRLGAMPSKRNDPEERTYARDLGNAIALLRLAKNISQEALAEVAGVTVGTIGTWEKGGNPPKSFQLAKMWPALGRPAARWFFEPPDSISPAEKDLAEIAGEVGVLVEAAYRRRRRASPRASVERGVPRSRPRKPSQPKRKPGSPA